MSIRQEPQETPGAGSCPTQDLSEAVTREARPATDDRTVRNAVFAGVRSKQLEIKDGAAHLTEKASPLFISRLAAAVGASVVLTPGITSRELSKSRLYLDKSVPSVTEMIREIKAATSAIDAKNAQLGGLLGNPTTGVEFGGKDFETPYRKYEHGAIYVTPYGTFEVHDAIYQKYVALGAQAGFLGAPQTDEQSTAGGTGRFNHFQGGSIYWSPATGAWSIHGPLRDKWWQMDGDRSYLGFPVSDIEPVSTGSVSYFLNGSLVQTFDGTFEDYPHSVSFTTPLETGHVKCTTEFGMNSRGDWYFRGHLHNAGFAGNVTTVVTTPMFVDAGGRPFAVSAERSLGGTLDKEDRNDDWDQMGTDDFIRENWGFLRSAGISTAMKANATAGDVLNIIFVPLGIIVVAAAGVAFGVHIATQKWCGPVASQGRDPITGETHTHLGWRLVDPGQPCPPGYQ